MCIHCVLVLAVGLHNMWLLAAKGTPPAVSECSWLWFLTLQLDRVTGDGTVPVPRVRDALATVTVLCCQAETSGLDQSRAAFRAKESIYCWPFSLSSACLTVCAQHTQSITKSRTLLMFTGAILKLRIRAHCAKVCTNKCLGKTCLGCFVT